MPQVDLETLVCGGDSKVACETLSDGGRAPPPPDDDPYLPPHSFEAPAGWSSGGGGGLGLRYRVYGREESTKGITNPKSGQANPKSRSSSERFSATANTTAKPPIIGLPSKMQTSRYDGRCVRRPTQGRIFPKKGGRSGGRKPAVPESEPGSPKVSCFGKVRSERERARRLREQQRGEGEERERLGCWANLAAIFGCGGVPRASGKEEARGGRSSSPPSRSAPAKTVGRASAEEQRAVAATATAEPTAGPGLGGMRRFSSGRRAASWGEEAETEGTNRRRRTVGSAAEEDE